MSEDASEEKKKMLKIVSDARTAALQEFCTEGIMVVNEVGFIKYCTDSVENILEFNQKDFLTTSLLDLVHPEDLEKVKNALYSVFSDIKSISLNHFRMRTKGGILRNFEGKFANKFDDPLLKGLVLSFRILDSIVEESNKNDDYSSINLTESPLFNGCVLASLTDQVAVLSIDGTILAVNDSWENFPAQMSVEKGKNSSVGSNYLKVCEDAVAGGDVNVKIIFDGILSVINRELSSFHHEYPYITPTVYKWFIVNVLPFAGDDSKVVITHQDITKRKLAEDKLGVTTQKLKTTLSNLTAILDSSLDLICTIDAKMEFQTVSKACFNILGYRPEELIGVRFIDLVHSDDIDRTAEAAKKIYGGVPEYLFENCYVHKSGRTVPLLWSVIWDDSLELMYCVAKDMTESKKLQRSIEMERDQYYNMFLKAPSAVVMLKGENHVYELANPLYLELVGKTDIVGKTVAEVIPEVAEQGFIKILDSVYQTGNSIRGKEVLIKLNNAGTGELVNTYVNFIFQAYRNLAGEIEGIFFFANDITEQIMARRMVEKSEKFFKGVTENSEDMLATLSAKGKILYTSPAVSKKYGFSVGEIKKMIVSDVIHPDDKLLSESFILEVLQQPAIPLFCSAVRQRKKDGTYIWVEATLTNFLDTDGINAIVVNFRDISERKKSESLLRLTLNELEDEKARLITAQKVAKIGSWQTNAETFEAVWSAETFHILGADPIMIRPSYTEFIKFIHPEDRDIVVNNFLETLNRKGVKSIEHRIITPKGKIKWIEEKWTVNSAEDGDAQIAIGTCQDITERKVAEEKILKSETKLKVAQHIAHVGSWELDLLLNEHSWSDEFYRILEIDKNVAPSSESFYKSIHTDDLETVISVVEEAANSNSTPIISFRFNRKNGEIGHACTEWKVEYNNEGQAAHIYGILRDLTEEHKAEEERQRMVLDIIRRNKDLEQFSYIISHNLRSPVANIVGLTAELRDESHSPETVVELREAISADVRRLEDVILDLNTIVQTKRDIIERNEAVSLSLLVKNILISINYLIENKNIQVKTNFKSIDEVWTIKSYMQSIFYNIISNSIKYRKSDIELILEIESQIINNKVILTFKDNGLGIDLDRYSSYMFGLYKRFHSEIEGKGLGLYMVKTQVETLGGTISVKSQVNIGTEFRIEFNSHP